MSTCYLSNITKHNSYLQGQWHSSKVSLSRTWALTAWVWIPSLSESWTSELPRQEWTSAQDRRPGQLSQQKLAGKTWKMQAENKNLIFAYRHRRVNSKAMSLAEAAVRNGELGLRRHFPLPPRYRASNGQEKQAKWPAAGKHTHTHTQYSAKGPSEMLWLKHNLKHTGGHVNGAET